MISKELLDKFKKLYLDKFNITLTDEEATSLATDFLNLMKILLRLEPKLENNQTNQKEEEDETSRILSY